MATQDNLFTLFYHPFSIASFLLLLFLFKWVLPSSTPKKNTPPSPPRPPIIGNLHQLGVYPHRSLQLLSKKYGDLMLLHLGSRPTIIVSSAEVASQILKTHDLIFASRPQLSAFKRLLTNGKEILTSPYGEYRRQMRSICVHQLLSNQKIRSFRKVREEEVALMIENIKGSSTLLVNLIETFISLNGDVICRVAFGKKYGGDRGGMDFKKLLNQFSELLGTLCVGDFISWLGWIDGIRGLDARIAEVTSKVDDFLERIIQEHMDHRRDPNEHGEDDPANFGNFVDVLLKTQREGGSGSSFLDKESIKGLILDMFAAGPDTTSTVLEWMMSELLKNTRVMKKLREEVTRFTVGKEIVTEDDLGKMAYLRAVIKETLRSHPPAPLMVPHESTQDVKINGYDIVAGTHVLVNIWSISRDPTYWDEPEIFHPERFMNSPIDFKGRNFEFTPFGSGRKRCPGMTFATGNIELGQSVHRKYPLLAIPIPRFS